MNLGFIGFGEAGFSIADGLAQEGLQNIRAYDVTINNEGFKSLLKDRANSANVTLQKSQEDIFENCDVIFAAVPAKHSLKIVKECEYLFNRKILYVDVSTAEPIEKKEMQKIINNKQASYVDAAMFGRLSINKHQVPIYASGSGVVQFIEFMRPYNMNITNIGDRPGDATSIKLIRSIFMKGYAALSIELLESAKHIGVEDHIINGIANSLNDSSFQENMNNFVTGTAIHAERRESELRSTLRLLQDLKLNSTMTEAIITKLKYVNNFNLNEYYSGRVPNDWSDVVNRILEKRSI